MKSVYGLNQRVNDLDYALVTLLFDNGAVANVEAFWGYQGPFQTAVEIAGSKGIIRSDSQKSSSLHICKAPSDSEGRRFAEVPQSPGYTSPYEREIAHFIQCIREGSEPIVTAQDAYKALEITMAASRIRSHGEIGPTEDEPGVGGGNSMKKLKVGMISFAHGHAYSYLDSLRAISQVEVTGIADENYSRVERVITTHDLPYYAHYQDLLATDVDAVIICSENVQSC